MGDEGKHIIEVTAQEGADTPDVRWIKILAEYLPRCGISLPSNPGILNIGCGNSVKWNYLAVATYLGTKDLGFPDYVGVDVEERAFEKAREALDGLVKFVVCDARRLSHFLSGAFHLAIFEHPNLSTSPEGPKIWRDIFKETAKLLEGGGGVILTSFWLNDHIPAQVALERAGYEVVHSGKNKFPGRQFDTANDGEPLNHDRYILIAKKRPSYGR